ncbi:MAG TPA: hypothetical protein VFV50_10360 [Bdellovibrionales bacterium]|nr:hypothetical protein [Bdellovibrionales bacterium]
MRILLALLILAHQTAFAGNVVHAQFEVLAAQGGAIVLIGNYYEAKVQCESSELALKHRYDQKLVGTFVFDSRAECEGFVQYVLSGDAKAGLSLDLYLQDTRVVGISRASYPRYK